MSDTYQWDVTIQTQQEVIGVIDGSQSIFYTGPFPSGTNQIVAYLVVDNIGDISGVIYYKLFEYPNTGYENLLSQGSINCAPGNACVIGNLSAIIPGGTNTYPLGIKVWGETESEPIWGQLGAYIWG